MKKLIKTDINNFYKDLGYSKEEKKVNEEIKKLKKKVAKSCIYFFIDVKRQYAPNGFLYIGQTNSIKNRILNYKGKNSELYIKLQKRLGSFNPYAEWEQYEDDYGNIITAEKEEDVELMEFVNDPERCKLIIKTRKKAENFLGQQQMMAMYDYQKDPEIIKNIYEVINNPMYDKDSRTEAQRQLLRINQGLPRFP